MTLLFVLIFFLRCYVVLTHMFACLFPLFQLLQKDPTQRLGYHDGAVSCWSVHDTDCHHTVGFKFHWFHVHLGLDSSSILWFLLEWFDGPRVLPRPQLGGPLRQKDPASLEPQRGEFVVKRPFVRSHFRTPNHSCIKLSEHSCEQRLFMIIKMATDWQVSEVGDTCRP